MNNFDYDYFFATANRAYVKEDHTQRYGQFLMNHLCKHHRSVYDSLPDAYDCFHDNDKVPAFLGYLCNLNKQ
jgi:hypothetical protein